jgi:hypothetical protein
MRIIGEKVHVNRLPVSASLIAATVLIFGLTACGDKAPTIKKSENSSRLAGSWVLKAKLDESGHEVPAVERQMKLVLSEDQLFQAEFRASNSEKWIRGGQGSFSYDPPLLTLYWEAGSTNPLLVREKDQNTIELHHCRTMIPVINQEPSEIFVRQKGGPTRGAS